MSAKQRCSRCGATLPGGKWRGFCPKCLARVSLGSALHRRSSNASPSEDMSNASTLDGPSTAPLRHFGDYELLEEIHRGGMGIVWRARQLKLDRIIALKLLRGAQFARPEDSERFRVEGAAVASLQHPHIVALHDFGVHEGQPWFSMDFIEGRTLAQLIRDKPPSPHDAAELLKTVAEAIAYAHTRGILHRDIKPSNILLDQNGQPCIADFGLAKRFGVPASAGGVAGGLDAMPPEGGTPNDLTLSGQLLGTPNYAPPEQLAVRRGALGPHSDVYALGAVLYEMLTGRPPFLAATIEATLLQVIDAEPVSPRLLNPAVPTDLETICLKCLEKAPARRYATAQELADELGRFLRAEPILARPVGAFGQLGRWCKRKPGWAAASALALLLLSAIVALTAIGNIRLRHREEVLRQNFYIADMHLVAQAIDASNLGHATELLEKWRPTPHSALRTSQSKDDLRGFEWYYFARLCQGDEILTLGTHSNVVTSLVYSPDGQRLSSGSEDGEIRLWELSHRDESDRSPPLQVKAHHAVTAPNLGEDSASLAASKLLGVARHASRINALAFSPDGRTLASGSADQSVRLWDAVTLREVTPPLSHATGIAALSFSTDSSQLAVASLDQLTVWDLATRTETSRQPIPIWLRAAISSDFKTIVLGKSDGSITLWDAAGRSRLAELRGHSDFVLPVALSGGGRWIAAGSFDNTATIWDVLPQKLLARLTNHLGGISALAFSPNSTRLATVSYDQNVKLWDTTTWRELGTLKGHRGAVWSVAFSPDNLHLATGGKDGTVRLWASQVKTTETNSWEIPPAATGRALSNDGLEFVARHANGTVTWRRIDAWDQPSIVAAQTKLLHGFSTVPQAIVLEDLNGEFGLWDRAGSGRITSLPAPGGKGLQVIAYSNTGKFIAGLSKEDLKIRVLNVASGDEVVRSLKGQYMTLAFSPDDGLLAAAESSIGIIVLWDLINRREIGRLRGHNLTVYSLTFSSNGQRLASSSTDGTVRLWDAKRQRELATFRAGVDSFWGMAFSPDGRRLAAGTGDGRVVLWDLVTKQEVATFRVQKSGMVGPVAFTRDGHTLVASAPQTVVRWRTAPR